ncbi:MAG TPA: metallopeptidase family protein [Terrimicrobiaceae bacterium]|nr:metallopeptidase family protein [Terrimicrobiaceae bacterium]
MSYEVSDVEFEQLLHKAIEQLPARWRLTIESEVPVRVEPRSSPKLLRELGMEEDELLLGLHEGTALTDRHLEDHARLPDVITLFKQDIEEASEDREDLVEQVRITLLHELGHHFGLDEDDLERLGYA